MLGVLTCFNVYAHRDIPAFCPLPLLKAKFADCDAAGVAKENDCPVAAGSEMSGGGAGVAAVVPPAKVDVPRTS